MDKDMIDMDMKLRASKIKLKEWIKHRVPVRGDRILWGKPLVARGQQDIEQENEARTEAEERQAGVEAPAPLHGEFAGEEIRRVTGESRQPEGAENAVNNVGNRRHGGRERGPDKRPALQSTNRAIIPQMAVTGERSVVSRGQESEEDARDGTQDRGTRRDRLGVG